jgi:hypothetical protein
MLQVVNGVLLLLRVTMELTAVLHNMVMNAVFAMQSELNARERGKNKKIDVSTRFRRKKSWKRVQNFTYPCTQATCSTHDEPKFHFLESFSEAFSRQKRQIYSWLGAPYRSPAAKIETLCDWCLTFFHFVDHVFTPP